MYGFDSFEGFDEAINVDLQLGGDDTDNKRIGGFGSTSQDDIMRRARALGIENTMRLVAGYFSETLGQCTADAFSFVHLDCDIYVSYTECLQFFYPRMSAGGIILFDEYNDPPWPGCNLAVDEFLSERPEKPMLIEIDNFQKWYVRKD